MDNLLLAGLVELDLGDRLVRILVKLALALFTAERHGRRELRHLLGVDRLAADDALLICCSVKGNLRSKRGGIRLKFRKAFLAAESHFGAVVDCGLLGVDRLAAHGALGIDDLPGRHLRHFADHRCGIPVELAKALFAAEADNLGVNGYLCRIHLFPADRALGIHRLDGIFRLSHRCPHRESGPQLNKHS